MGRAPSHVTDICEIIHVLHLGTPAISSGVHQLPTMAVPVNPEFVRLAQTLPKRLLNFFRKYPPPALTSTAANWKPPKAPQTTPPEKIVVASTTSSADPNVPAEESGAAEESTTTYYNPFLPRKNFKTGKWYGPVYGLRKQADIVKLAQKHGVVNLLPYTIKLPEVRLKRRLEGGLRVKGTGVGEKVKGKIWERTLKGRLEQRKQAMLDMPRLVQEWKQVRGYGLGCSTESVTDNLVERAW